MKIVRLNDEYKVVEIMPYANLAQVELSFHSTIVNSCIETSDEVDIGWSVINGEFIPPIHEPIPHQAPDMTIENYLLDLDYRLSLIELGVN